jgi:hypothetical protein
LREHKHTHAAFFMQRKRQAYAARSDELAPDAPRHATNQGADLAIATKLAPTNVAGE